MRTPEQRRTHRIWLALLLPLLVLAVAASSYRMVNLYRPWQWSRPIVASAPSGTLTQDFTATDGTPLSRTVTVSVDDLRTVARDGEDAAAPGATLWLATLTLSADPDQVLNGCEVELVDATGTRYATTSAGKQPADGDASRWMPSHSLTCVPADAPGPQMGFAGVDEATVERPPSWTMTASAALPDGVSPTTLRIMWTQPVYLELQAPA